MHASCLTPLRCSHRLFSEKTFSAGRSFSELFRSHTLQCVDVVVITEHVGRVIRSPELSCSRTHIDTHGDDTAADASMPDSHHRCLSRSRQSSLPLVFRCRGLRPRRCYSAVTMLTEPILVATRLRQLSPRDVAAAGHHSSAAPADEDGPAAAALVSSATCCGRSQQGAGRPGKGYIRAPEQVTE